VGTDGARHLIASAIKERSLGNQSRFRQEWGECSFVRRTTPRLDDNRLNPRTVEVLDQPRLRWAAFIGPCLMSLIGHVPPVGGAAFGSLC